jgi:molecular chaperone GrpE
MVEEDKEQTQSDESSDLKKALEEERKKSADYLARWQRAQADYANLKRQTEQEKRDTIAFANSTLMLRLLPALDDFERAYTHVPPDFADAPWIEGIRLVERKLRLALESQGLIPMKTLGEIFDPSLMQAIQQAPGKEGVVVQEALRGYLLNGRVLRPASVIVGNGEADEGE